MPFVLLDGTFLQAAHRTLLSCTGQGPGHKGLPSGPHPALPHPPGHARLCPHLAAPPRQDTLGAELQEGVWGLQGPRRSWRPPALGSAASGSPTHRVPGSFTHVCHRQILAQGGRGHLGAGQPKLAVTPRLPAGHRATRTTASSSDVCMVTVHTAGRALSRHSVGL